MYGQREPVVAIRYRRTPVSSSSEQARLSCHRLRQAVAHCTKSLLRERQPSRTLRRPALQSCNPRRRVRLTSQTLSLMARLYRSTLRPARRNCPASPLRAAPYGTTQALVHPPCRTSKRVVVHSTKSSRVAHQRFRTSKLRRLAFTRLLHRVQLSCPASLQRVPLRWYLREMEPAHFPHSSARPLLASRSVVARLTPSSVAVTGCYR